MQRVPGVPQSAQDAVITVWWAIWKGISIDALGESVHVMTVWLWLKSNEWQLLESLCIVIKPLAQAHQINHLDKVSVSIITFRI